MKDLTYRQKFALREIAAKLRGASERKNALATKLTEFTSASGHTRKSAKEDPARLKLVKRVQAIEAEISALKSRRHDIQPFDPAAEAKIRATGLVAERDRLLAANERLAGLAERGIAADRLTVENNRLQARCISLETMVAKLQDQISELRLDR